jgi:hypothetical protein
VLFEDAVSQHPGHCPRSARFSRLSIRASTARAASSGPRAPSENAWAAR